MLFMVFISYYMHLATKEPRPKIIVRSLSEATTLFWSQRTQSVTQACNEGYCAGFGICLLISIVSSAVSAWSLGIHCVGGNLLCCDQNLRLSIFVIKIMITFSHFTYCLV